jgi:hypothetical protein
MRARVADMGLVVGTNGGVLGFVSVMTLQAWANLTLVLISIAFTIWRWFRVAKKTKPKVVAERPNVVGDREYDNGDEI